MGAYKEGAAQEGAALRMVGQVIEHCWIRALIKLFRLMQVSVGSSGTIATTFAGRASAV